MSGNRGWAPQANMGGGNHFVPQGYNYMQPAASAQAASAQAAKNASALNAGTGASAGGILGSFAGPVGTILGAVGGAVIGGIFDAVQGNSNRKESQRQQQEARAMAERQFAWGQQMDRFDMRMQSRQMHEAEKMNRHQITRSRIDSINEMLRTNVGLQNHVRSLWGGK